MSTPTSPAHYQAGGGQCIDVTKHMPFCTGNAYKYVYRAGKKTTAAEAEDLSKALVYLDWAIERDEGHVYPFRLQRLAALAAEELGPAQNVHQALLDMTLGRLSAARTRVQIRLTELNTTKENH